MYVCETVYSLRWSTAQNVQNWSAKFVFGGQYYHLPQDKIVSRDRNVISLACPMWRNGTTVFKFRVSYEHEKAQFTSILIWSQVVTMAKSCRKCWFQSGIFLVVIIVCIICVCESRYPTRSPSTTTGADRADPKIIDVPQRTPQAKCVNGRKADGKGNCRAVWR